MTETDLPRTESSAKRFRRYFVTGLLVLAPLWLTVYVILLVVELLGGFLSPYFRVIGRGLFGTGKWTGLVTTIADATAFIATVLGIALIGLLVRKVVGQRLVETLNRLLSRIPVVREIYDSIRKFIDIFFGDKSNFQRVVAVHFPTDETWAIGFVTGENRIQIDQKQDQTMHSVFIPTSPNPTSGYLLFATDDRLVPLDLSVDEAMKLVVTGGTLIPDRHMVEE